MEIKLYLLELAHGKFYIGQASDPVFRFKEHLAGTGSKWTRLHRPVKIRKVQMISVENPAQAMLYENWTTLQAMERFGWENVRGGDFLVVEGHLLRRRIEHIYDFEKNKIRYYTDDYRRVSIRRGRKLARLCFGTTQLPLLYWQSQAFG
jgi:predicted GIY-YIG superfamily endonuclease